MLNNPLTDIVAYVTSTKTDVYRHDMNEKDNSY